MKVKNALIPLLIITTICTLGLGNTAVFAPPPPTTEPVIDYVGHWLDATSVTFHYSITAGTRDVTKWQLWSPCFTSDKVMLQEEQHLNPAQHFIHMEHRVESGQTYYFYIVLKNGYYTPYSTGQIDYKIWAGPDHPEGTVLGPVPTTFLMSENSMGITAVTIPMIIALGLLSVSGKYLRV